MLSKPLNPYKTLVTKAGNRQWANPAVWRYLLPPLECPGQKTVVLDLDQTLVNVVPGIAGDRFAIRHDFVVQWDDDLDDDDDVYYVLKRPFVDEFLECLSKNGFEIVVFTAGTKEYASQVLDFLDPSKSLITHRLYRDSCKAIYGGDAYIKELSRLGRDLRKVVIVDDNPISYSLNRNNGIPIISFMEYGDYHQDDDELMNLMGYFCQNRDELFFKKFNNTKNYRDPSIMKKYNDSRSQVEKLNS